MIENKERPVRPLLSFLVVIAAMATSALGQSTDIQTDAQPVLSQHGQWAALLVLIIVAGIFLPAAILGPYLRRRTAGRMPELHDAQEHDAHTAAQHEPGHNAPAPSTEKLAGPVD